MLNGSGYKPGEKKKKTGKNDEETLPDLKSAHRRSQAKCQPERTVYIKHVRAFSFGHKINNLLTELTRSVRMGES